MKVSRRGTGPTPTANPDVFPSPTLDYTATGVTDILTVPVGRIFAVYFCMDHTNVISGAGPTPHTYKIKTDSGVDIIPAFISVADALNKFTRREAADEIVLVAGEKVQVEITIGSTFTTHTGRVFIHGLEVAP